MASGSQLAKIADNSERGPRGTQRGECTISGKTRVIGIDPGFAAMGLAVLERGAGGARVLRQETLRTQPGGRSDLARLDVLGGRLWALAREYGPDAIGYEDQAGVEVAAHRGAAGSNARSRRVHEVVGIIRGLALGLTLPLHCLAPSTAKLALLGRGGGRGSKQQVKAAVQRLFGLGRCSEHAADAVAIALGTLAKTWR